MKIQLIDIDSMIPNLALMRISSYHKAQGDIVGFDVDEPDKVYISCIFNKNKEQALGVGTYYPNAEVNIGGSGVNYDRLPLEMQKIYPDYDLYNNRYDMDYSLGFTTRGCIRNCPFCIVRDKEGVYKQWQHISEFHNPEFKKVRLLDNNIYFDRDWFFDNTDFLIEHKLKVDINQGMDIRLLDSEIAQRLKELKWFATLKFAFDNMKDERAVRSGIELLKDVKVDIRHKVQFYVLVGYNTTPDQDLYRCNLLKELGTNAFVMPFIKNAWTNKLARWANRKCIFWDCSFDEYGVD